MRNIDGYLLGCLLAAALFAVTWGDRAPELVLMPLVVLGAYRVVINKTGWNR